MTNALDAEMNLALGYSTSGAEELQKKLPNSRVGKAFNTVFAQHMDSGRLGEQPLTAFAASDDSEANGTVLELARGIGFEAVDGGPLRNARLLEPLGYLNIQLGYGWRWGPRSDSGSSTDAEDHARAHVHEIIDETTEGNPHHKERT